MPVPKLSLSQDKMNAIERFILFAKEDVDTGRNELVTNYGKWAKAYEAKFVQKDTPFQGASGVTLPTIATDVDALGARFLNTAFGNDPIALFRPRSTQWTEFAEETQRFFPWVLEEEVDLYGIYREAVPIMLKYGTVFLGVFWENLPQKRFVLVGDEFTEKEIDLLDKPVIRVIHPKDFFCYPLHEKNLQEAQICGYRYLLKRGTLLEWKRSGFFDEKIADQLLRLMGPQGQAVADPDYDIVEAQQQQEAGILQTRPKGELEMLHLYMRWDVDGSGRETEVTCHYSVQLGKVARMAFPHYKHMKRPFVKHGFQPRDGMLYDMGVAEMEEGFQEVTSTLMRQIIDNNTARNTHWFTYKANKFTDPVLNIFAGARVPVKEHEDIKERNLGPAGTFDTRINDIQFLDAARQQRVGIADLNLGQETGKGTPATTALAVLQEASKKLDNHIRDFRRGLQEVIMLILQLYHQFKPRIVYSVQGLAEGEILMRTWAAVGDEDLRKRISVQATASTASLNKAVQRTENTTLFTQLVSYFEQFQALMSLGAGGVDPQTGVPIPPDPRLQELAFRMAKAMNLLMDRILDTYDIKNRTDYLADPALLAPPANVAGEQAAPGAPGAAGQNGGTGALGDLVAQAGRAGAVPQPLIAPGRPLPGSNRGGQGGP